MCKCVRMLEHPTHTPFFIFAPQASAVMVMALAVMLWWWWWMVYLVPTMVSASAVKDGSEHSATECCLFGGICTFGHAVQVCIYTCQRFVVCCQELTRWHVDRMLVGWLADDLTNIKWDSRLPGRLRLVGSTDSSNRVILSLVQLGQLVNVLTAQHVVKPLVEEIFNGHRWWWDDGTKKMIRFGTQRLTKIESVFWLQ